jgi:uncharacterized protein (TIGR02391 family)
LTRATPEHIAEGHLGLTPETILDLPVETLALVVLQNFHAAQSWNVQNWMGGAERALGPGPHLDALAESWAWLESRALVMFHTSQSAQGARKLTRAGLRAVESGSLSEIQAAERLSLDLHPRLAGKVRPIFLLGDYETAAFKAMKEVEVRVRTLSGLSEDLVGVALMRRAFHPETGRLTDPEHEGGERQARADLFAGALGSFKNPTSHRTVTYADPVEASEVVLLADLLMRILDQVEARKL